MQSNRKNIFQFFRKTDNFSTKKEAWHQWVSAINSEKYSDSVLLMVLKPVFDELKKVEFSVREDYERELGYIARFFNENYMTLYRALFDDGFVGLNLDAAAKHISIDELNFFHSPTKYSYSFSNPNSVATAEFLFFQKSQKNLISEIMENIDTGLTAQRAIMKILGQFTIFSKEKQSLNERSIPLSEKEQKDFNEIFGNLLSGKNIGTSVYHSNSNLKRDTIVFPLDRLKIVENTTFSILMLAGAMNVPYDLVPITGHSTYANQEEAINYLRTHTVNGIAETFLELAKKAVKRVRPTAPSTIIDYFIPEPEDLEASEDEL